MHQAADVIADLRARAVTGAAPVGSIAAPDARLGASAIIVHDDIFPDIAPYTAWARQLPYGSIPIGAAVFHGIAPTMETKLADWIRAQYPQAEPKLTFFRQSPAGQQEPNYIHTDRDMGDWTGILYLTETPADGDGTTFWRRRTDGATASTAETESMFHDEWATWRLDDQWEPWHTVVAKPNRLLLFPAPLFHSRAIRDNYGQRDVDARLIQIVFGTGVLG